MRASLPDAGTRHRRDWSYQGQADLAAAGLKPAVKVALTGGHFWQQVDFDINTAGRHVLDFKNTSAIGHFRHIILNAQRHPVADVQGGIESSEINPFFLRHGREIDLPVGHYRLLTELNSPFFLADPQPYLDTLDNYRQAIKPGNALTLLCMGIFLGLMIYYAAQAIVRWNLSAAMYSIFIFGNLLYNGSSLLVFPELFDMHWIYLVSIPILFSNCAYILFVMSLLEIRHDTYPRLYTAGAGAGGLAGRADSAGGDHAALVIGNRSLRCRPVSDLWFGCRYCTLAARAALLRGFICVPLEHFLCWESRRFQSAVSTPMSCISNTWACFRYL